MPEREPEPRTAPLSRLDERSVSPELILERFYRGVEDDDLVGALDCVGPGVDHDREMELTRRLRAEGAGRSWRWLEVAESEAARGRRTHRVELQTPSAPSRHDELRQRGRVVVVEGVSVRVLAAPTSRRVQLLAALLNGDADVTAPEEHPQDRPLKRQTTRTPAHPPSWDAPAPSVFSDGAPATPGSFVPALCRPARLSEPIERLADATPADGFIRLN
jgi:hypothetical protein